MKYRHRAVRCVIERSETFLLAVHDNKRPENIGKWGLPGGIVEDGESLIEAAEREIREEFGISLGPWRELAYYEYRDTLQVALATSYDGDGVFDIDSSEILEVGWFDLDDLRRMDAAGQLHTGFEVDAIERSLGTTRPADSETTHPPTDPETRS